MTFTSNLPFCGLSNARELALYVAHNSGSIAALDGGFSAEQGWLAPRVYACRTKTLS